MFNQYKERATTRIIPKTEGGFKKNNTFHTTRVTTPNQRNYQFFKKKIMSQEKRNKSSSKKKNHTTLNIFKQASRTIQVSEPSSIQFKHQSNRNQRSININSFNHRYLRTNRNEPRRGSKTPLVDNYFNRSTRNSQHQYIHEKVQEKCLSFVKQVSKPPEIINSYNCFNKKQKILVELHKQSVDFEKKQTVKKQEKVTKPYLQLTRLGRMFGPSRVERQRFRIDLTNQELCQHFKSVKQSKIKKQLFKQSPFQIKSIKNNQCMNELAKNQKTLKTTKVPLIILPQIKNEPLKKVQFQQKIQLQKLQQILSVDQNVLNSKKSHQNSIVKNTKSKIISQINFTKKQQQNKPIVMIKKQQPILNIDDSIVQIMLDTKQSDLVYQDEQLSDDVTKPISNPSKPKISLQQHHLQTIQPILPVATQDVIKNKNQQIRPIGEIIGHGLKVLKGINFNWILPCVLLYKKFYQLRVQIQNLAQQSDLQNEFICRNRYQNQRILQSYGNMMKAVEKKPITQQKQIKLRESKVTDPVCFQDIIEQILSYEQDIEQFNGKQDQISLIKSHFVLILNSVIILGQHQKLIKQVYQVNINNEDCDKEIHKALELIKSLKQK